VLPLFFGQNLLVAADRVVPAFVGGETGGGAQKTLADIEDSCQEFAKYLGVSLFFRQSNHEGELVDWIQSAREKAAAVVMNPAGFSQAAGTPVRAPA
jgi:hypothetical protein